MKFLFIPLMLCSFFRAKAQQKAEPVHFVWEQVKTDAVTELIDRKAVSGQQGTIGCFVFKKGAVVPLHQHVNEQYTLILKGSVSITLNGKIYLVKAGEGFIIPPNLPHQFEALEEGTIDIDFFTPQRTDWLNGTDNYFKSQKP